MPISPDLIERLATPIMVFVTFVAVIFVVIRPLMRYSVKVLKQKHGPSAKSPRPAAGNAAAALADEDFAADLAQLEGRLEDTDLAKIKQLAISDPEKAKQLVQAWLHQK